MSNIKPETIGSALDEDHGGFVHSEVYIGFAENFDSLVAPLKRDGASPATTLAELIEVAGPHTFVSGAGFTKVRAIQETVGLESTQIGEAKKSPVVENKLTIEMVGSKADLLGYGRLLKGRELVVLAQEAGTDQVRQLGSAKFPAYCSEWSAVVEPLREGENKSTFVFMDKQKYAAPIYTGVITEQPAP